MTGLIDSTENALPGNGPRRDGFPVNPHPCLRPGLASALQSGGELGLLECARGVGEVAGRIQRAFTASW